jgi:hypothetical protein
MHQRIRSAISRGGADVLLTEETGELSTGMEKFLMRLSSSRPKNRARRRDAGKTRLTQRDIFALTWIAHQYAIRLDHLQWLLGRYAGYGARHANWVSENAARNVVHRWKQMGYVHVAGIRDKEPFWIWTSQKGLKKLGLPYTYTDLEASGLDAFTHLHAINTIRLGLEADTPDLHWTSERTLRREQVRIQDKAYLHRPDGVAVFADGLTIALEAELSTKKPWELGELLLELLRGEEYLRSKLDLGTQMAQTLTRWQHSPYEEIWYFAPKNVRKLVRRVRARLVADGVISEEEAQRICVWWYPLTNTDAELSQEEREENEAFGLAREEEETRPEREDGPPDR